MVVCRNWDGRPGSCRFGDRCRFEHPPSDRGVSSSNTFAPLQRDQPTNSHGHQIEGTLPYQLDKNQIITDLSTERPQWILSAYGPGRNAPEQLFGGSMREQSFEEMRVLHYLGMRSGNHPQVAQEAAKLVQESEQQMQAALSNIDGAIDYILRAKDKHPNRIDIVQQSISGAQQNTNAFAGGTNINSFQAIKPASNTFGAPSQSATTSTFGAPTSGAMSGAFGQPSALGLKSNPFAAPTRPAFGTPAFGAPSQPGAGGAFGQPSTLRQKSNPFAAPTSGGFSSFANAGSAFGKPSQPATSSPFGVPSQPAVSNPFGSSSQSMPNSFSGPSPTPFGVPSPAPKNPFASPSTQTSAVNSFAGSAPKPNPFVTAPTTAVNPFSNPQPSGPASSNPFGRPSNGPSPANTNSFGDSRPVTASNSHSGALQSYQPVKSGNMTQHPPLESYATLGPNKRLATFKGETVIYKDGQSGFQRADKKWERIWFPEGPPPFNGETEMEDSAYDDETKAAYMHLRQTGTFKDGVIPMIPPKREWCLWDF